MSMLPAGMDGRKNSGSASSGTGAGGLPNWQRNATETISRTRPGTKASIRSVTPEAKDHGPQDITGELSVGQKSGVEKPIISTSPRPLADRRNGLVFEDPDYGSDLTESFRSGPPVSLNSLNSVRPRTRTLEDSISGNRQRSISTNLPPNRHRVGRSTSTAYHDTQPPPEAGILIKSRPVPQLQKSNSIKGGRRLMKKSSRSASPLPPMSDTPYIDSLPLPVTGDANKILMLMKTLCGRMRGEVEYQDDSGVWLTGISYIEETKGALMLEGDDRGPFHITVVSDLRGARVRPLILKEKSAKCIEISNPILGLEVRIIPSVKAEFDLWLAALLCWQQIRPSLPPLGSPKHVPVREERRPSVQSLTGREKGREPAPPHKEANVIKIAKILLWDRGVSSTPKSIVRRPLTRDLRVSPARSWRSVSCILHDNGELRLLLENDVTLLSVIQLSQLSRSAIQRLDKSVLDEEFCIAIFPQYTSTSTQLSIFRPVYIALDSRIVFEVWFCLLRSFSMPEIYGPQISSGNNDMRMLEAATNDMFRIEKTLAVRVVEAKMRRTTTTDMHLGKHPGKPEQDISIGDYFAEVVLDGEIRARTMTKLDTRNPFWREDCEFHDLPAHLPSLSIILKKIKHAEASTHGFLSSGSVHVQDYPVEAVCGILEIPVDQLERGKDTEAWYPILGDKEEPLGEIFLKIRHDELVVLLAKDYQEISELLHRFANGLTVQIAQATTGNLRKLAEVMMNIFQVSGHASDWLMALVEDEIDSIQKELPAPRARFSRRLNSNESSISEREQSIRELNKSLHGEANLLFRGNSLLTQALDFHMRRLGKEYLEDVLKDIILQITALNPDCEVDPSRLPLGEDLDRNWSQLTFLTSEVWGCMEDSASKCPPELRQILKYIRAVAEDRYGKFLRTVQYTSVSGFLFLRFFCPALLNPKLFGLLKDHPQPKAQRALTLIAKALQALANLSTFGQKEAWMEPMNKFINSHRQPVKKFIDDICSIPSERSTFALPASYSTPITILARLPPTSREGFPSLPYLIDHARNFSALVKLWLDSTAERDDDEPFEGELWEFNRHCIDLQLRTDECLLKAESTRESERAFDRSPMQWEDITEGLEKSTIHEQATSPTTELQSPSWAGYSASTSSGRRLAPESADHHNKGKQNFWEQTFGKDSRFQRPYDYQKPSAPSPEPSPVSPPIRGMSGSSSGKQRGFLSSMLRKGNDLLPNKEAQATYAKQLSPNSGYSGNGSGA